MFYTPGSTNIAAWKMDMYCIAGKWICLYTFKLYFHVFPIEDGDIPANFVFYFTRGPEDISFLLSFAKPA